MEAGELMVIIYVFLSLMLFLGGLKIMSAGLAELGGSSFAQAVRHWTGQRGSAFLVGVFFTALTQSSSLATVIVVGMVDARIISLGAAIAVIAGANVGTTVTGQLISFRVYDYAPLLVAAGTIFFLSSRKGRRREAGRALLGLGILLSGLNTMHSFLVPQAEKAWVKEFLEMAAINPSVAIFAGAAVTAIVQSSSAVMALTIALAQEGVLSLAAGVGILVGADVGTCVTSLLAGLGTGVNARRAAVAHLVFNLLSMAIVLPVFQLLLTVAAASAEIMPRQLANAHTIYNLSGAVMLLIFLSPFQLCIERLIMPENTVKRRILGKFGEIIKKWF
jgi:phosphate:Na+ symporter